MLFIKNLSHFRRYYKKEIALRTDHDVDPDFIDVFHPDSPSNKTKGFGNLVYGTRRNGIGKFLRSISLKTASDTQALYELLQNADDEGANFFAINYDNENLLCINNGNQFTRKDFAAIINVADNEKDESDIGSFGIGFKILHRLVGKDDGQEEIINNYAGPVIFSWNKFFHFKAFLNKEIIEVNKIRNKDDNCPWLAKLIYTCFPTHPNETVLDKNFQDNSLFRKEELSDFQSFLSKTLKYFPSFNSDNNLKRGSIFFLKFGEGKGQKIQDYTEYFTKSIGNSLLFLNNLKKVYIKGELVNKRKCNTKSFVIPKDSELFENISPEMLDRDICIDFAYCSNYEDALDFKQEVSLYNYFGMNEEVLGFSFLIHCNAFDMHNDRAKLQAPSDRNDRLLPVIATKISKYILDKKDKKQNLFLNLYAAFLLSDEPKKEHIKNSLFNPLMEFVYVNIPTKSNTYQSDATKVKIKNTTLNIELSDFGFENYDWYYWSAETDADLISCSERVLGIEKWDLKDIIEQSTSDNINSFLQSKKIDVPSFLKEVCKSGNVRDKVKTKLVEDVSFISFGDEFLSIADIVKKDNYLLCLDSIVVIKPLLEQIGFSISDINFSSPIYKPLLDEIISKYISEASVFNRIKSKIEQIPEEENNEIPENLKVAVFNAITKDFSGCIFGEIGPVEIKKLKIFKNQKEVIVTLGELINPILKVPEWLSGFQPKATGIAGEKYFISEAAIYGNIIIPYWKDIINDVEIASLSTFFEKVKSYYELAPEESKVSLTSNERTYLPVLQAKLLGKNDLQLQWVNNSHDIFFNQKFSTIVDYAKFIALSSCISSQPLPANEIFGYITEEPFKTDQRKLADTLLSKCSILVELTDLALVLSYESSLIWRYYSLINQDEKWWLSYKTADSLTLQLTSNSKLNNLDETLLSELSFSLSFLPALLSDYNNDVQSDEEIIGKIIDEVDLSTHLLTILNFDLSQANFEKLISKTDFLISLDSNEKYTSKSNEYLLFKWFQKFYNNDNEDSKPRLTSFRNSIRVKIGENLQSIPQDLPETDDLKLGGETFALSKILPNTYAITGILNSIKNQFKDLNLSINTINKVFGLSSKKSETNTNSIFSLVTEELENNKIESNEQLKFIVSYLNSNPNAPNDFEVKVIGSSDEEADKYVKLNSCDFVLKKSGVFTDLNKVIDTQKYIGFIDWFDKKGNRIMSIGTSASLSLEPRLLIGGLSLVGVKTELKTDEEKIALLNYFFEKWENVSSVKSKWDKADISELAEKVELYGGAYFYPDKYAIKDLDELPIRVTDWIEKKPIIANKKLEYLSAFGIYAGDAPEILIRKFLLNEVALDTALLKGVDYKDAIGAISFILTKSEIKFEENGRQQSLQKLVEHINDTLPKDKEENKFLWEYTPDFDTISNLSKPLEDKVFNQWNDSQEPLINIFVYSNSSLPEFVKTNQTGNHVFYKRFDKSLIQKENTIDVYISSNRVEDIEEVLSELKKSGFPQLNLTKYRDIKYKTKPEQNDFENPDDGSVDEGIVEKLNKDVPKEVQQSENYSSLLIVLRYLEKLKWKKIEEAILEKTKISCIENSEGKEMTVVVRSGKGGIFYLRDFNWSEDLQDDNTILAIVSGDTFNDIELVYNQNDLLKKFVEEDDQIKYHILRIPKSVDLDTLNSVAKQLSDSANVDSQFLFKSKNNSKYTSIFSDKKKKGPQLPNETSPGSEDNFEIS